MDHQYIEQHDIADRYLMGKLAPEEEHLFELHLMDCRACVERVEESEGLRAGLRRAAYVPPPVRATVWRWATLAACAACLTVFLSLYFTLGRLDRAKQELASGRSRAPLPQPGAGLGAASLYTFDLARGGELGGSPPPNRVLLPSPPQTIVVSLRLEPNPAFPVYRLTIRTASGEPVAERRDLALDANDRLIVTLPSSLLHPGDYGLRVEGRIPQGGTGYTEIATYTFRAVPQP